jgi:hypothetical protein
MGRIEKMPQAKSASSTHVTAVFTFWMTLIFDFSSSDHDMFEGKPHSYDCVKNYSCKLYSNFPVLQTYLAGCTLNTAWCSESDQV